MEKNYDVVVIGAGSGGLTSAVGFSKVGKKVLLVEKEHMGGECTNSGCVPSKALLHAAKTGINGSEALQYVRSTVDHILEEETPDVFEKIGIDVVMGEAVFTSKNGITVNTDTYTFKHAVIATGSGPRLIDIAGLDEQHVLTNQNLFQLEDIPKRLLIIGGGPIGLEMAEAFARLGSTVTIAERASEFGRLEDPAIRPILRSQFETLGVTVKTSATIDRVEGTTAHFNHMHGETVDSTYAVEFDKVLIAIGRVPNIPAGLDAAGIKATEHGITIDSQHRTTNKRIYAVGDVAQRLKFTHMADDLGRQIVTRVVSRGLVKVKHNKSVPKVTYTSPEVAQVGLSWEEAKDVYGEASLMRIEVPLSQNDRAKTDDATDGIVVVIARRLSGKVLGAHIIAPRAGELLAIFSLAIDHKITLWKLQKHIFAYPTYALLAKKTGDQFVGRQISDLKNDLLQLLKRQATKLFAAALWIAGLYALSRYQASTGLTTTETSVKLFEFITMTAWGPLIYIVLYAVRPVTFFPATALTILSGVFFGFIWGTVLTVVAATLAAAVAYGVGRFFGQDLKLERGVLSGLVTTMQNHAFTGVLAARLSFLPFDLLSYAAGIIRVSFVPYIIATFIGIILGTATFVAIGASLDLETFIRDGFSLDIVATEFLILSAVVFIASLFVSKLFKTDTTV